MLDAHDRERYGRQIRLPEVGLTGQQRLLNATISVCADASPTAARVAQEYLSRAGLILSQDRASGSINLLSEEGVSALCKNADYLEEAAGALAGAFAAVESIKSVVHAGSPAPFPMNLTLAQET